MWGFGGVGKEKMKEDGLGRETNRKSLNLKKQTEGCWRDRRGWWGYDIGEGMCYDECCEMCKPGDSQTCTRGDKNTLYVY